MGLVCSPQDVLAELAGTYYNLFELKSIRSKQTSVTIHYMLASNLLCSMDTHTENKLNKADDRLPPLIGNYHIEHV